MLIDTHAHLQDPVFDQDIVEVIQRASEAGVTAIITIGTDVPDSEKGLQLTERFPEVYASVGLHPNEAAKWQADSFEALNKLAQRPKVVTIGETGLDYHYAPTEQTKKLQEQIFRSHIRIAREQKLPLMIHTRDAHEETISILKDEKAAELGGTIHCYSGDWATAQRYIELNFSISLGGVVTFGKKAKALEEVGEKIPAERLVLETDCPYLAPVPFRGKRNEPAFVAHTAARLAVLRSVSRTTIESISSDNARRLFRIN